METRVAIIGSYQTEYEECKKGKSLTELVFTAARGALDDAGLEIGDIDNIVLAAHDLIDGRNITTMLTAAPAGAYLKDEIRVADDGAFAVALAFLRLQAGYFKRTLVVSWSKLSEVDFDTITNLSFDPLFYRPAGLNYVTAHAMQAMVYMDKYGINEEDAARVVVKNRSNALRNPLAHLKSEVGIEEVMDSRMLSWPLKELDLPPKSDGACAMILAADGSFSRKRDSYAWIKGIGWSNDTYYLGDKDLSELSSLKRAADRAYEMAGIKDPIKELDAAELHDLTSFHELMAYEALGLCSSGEGGKLVEYGNTHIGGKISVNPSGGVLSSHPHTAVGLIRVAEAALQVTGMAEDHQVSNCNLALAHGSSGICSQSNCVIVLSN